MATFNAHMKTLTFMLAALFISCASLSAYAEEMSTRYNIPERYALLVVTGADPSAPLDTKKLGAILSEEFKKANIEQMQILIYDEGKKPGDGARAFGEIRKDSKVETAPVDRSGLLGLHIYVDMKDPNLRKVKKGDIVTMQAFPQKFLMRSVMMEGTIVFVEHSKKK